METSQVAETLTRLVTTSWESRQSCSKWGLQIHIYFSQLQHLQSAEQSNRVINGGRHGDISGSHGDDMQHSPSLTDEQHHYNYQQTAVHSKKRKISNSINGVTSAQSHSGHDNGAGVNGNKVDAFTVESFASKKLCGESRSVKSSGTAIHPSNYCLKTQNRWFGSSISIEQHVIRHVERIANRHIDRSLTYILELLVNQTFIGTATPSSLLLSYLNYAVSTRLIDPIHFFQTIMNQPTIKPDPKKPAQFTAYLELLSIFIKDLFTQVIASDSTEGCKIIMQLGILLVESVNYFVNRIQDWTMSTQTADQQVVPSLDTSVHLNISSCIKLLIHMFKKQHTATFLLLGKEEFSDTWALLIQTVDSLLSKYQQLQYISSSVFQSIWVQLNECLSLMINTINVQPPLKSILPNQILDQSVENQSNRPWLSVAFTIEEEISGKAIRTLAQTTEHLDGLRRLKKQSVRNLLVEAWLATLRSMQNFEPDSDEWKVRRCYLTAKIPSVVELWVEQQLLSNSIESAEPTEIEWSISDLSAFPSVTQRDLLEDIIRVCAYRQLLSIDRMQSLFPDKQLSLLVQQDVGNPLSLEGITSGRIPKTPQEVESLRHYLLTINLKTDTLFTAISSITAAMTESLIQKQLTALILELTDPKTARNWAIPSTVFSALSNNAVLLDIIRIQDGLLQLVGHAGYFLDLWGNSRVSQDGLVHHHFGSAYYLLLTMFDRFEVRIEGNAEMFQEGLLRVNSLVLRDKSDTDIMQFMKTLYFDKREDNASQLSLNYAPWQIFHTLLSWVKQSVIDCAQGKVAVGVAVEAAAALYKRFPYASYAINYWLCNELELGSPSITIINLDSDVPVPLQLLLQLVESISTQVVLNLLGFRIITLVQPYQQVLLEPLPSKLLTRSYPPKITMSTVTELETLLHAYFSTMLNGEMPNKESNVSHFKWLLGCIGKQKFCDIVIKELMKTISKKTMGVSSFHTLCTAELAGCLIGSCGLESLIELCTSLLPAYISQLQVYSQGEALAYLTVFATVYSGLSYLPPDSRHYQEALSSLKGLYQISIQMLQKFSYNCDAILSFPVTLISLLGPLPNMINLLPKGQLLPLVDELKELSPLDIIDFSNKEDRKLCREYFATKAS